MTISPVWDQTLYLFIYIYFNSCHFFLVFTVCEENPLCRLMAFHPYWQGFFQNNPGILTKPASLHFMSLYHLLLFDQSGVWGAGGTMKKRYREPSEFLLTPPGQERKKETFWSVTTYLDDL